MNFIFIKQTKKHSKNMDVIIYEPEKSKSINWEDECDVSIWKKFPTNVYCQKGGDEFPDNGYKNNVNQEECEQFCTENAGCAGFLHRHGKNNCKGQCHIRPGTPVEGGKEPGPLMCRYDKDGAGYSFYENPTRN